MSKKIFTDDDGNKYEPLDLGIESHNGEFSSDGPEFINLNKHYVIKPIKKAEEKQFYRIDFENLQDTEPSLYFEQFKFTIPQAQAVAEAIKALLEYTTKPLKFPEHALDNLVWDFKKARKLLKEDV